MTGPIRTQTGARCGICGHTVSRWIIGSWQHGSKVFRLFGPETEITDYDEVVKFCERCAPKIRAEVLHALRETIARLRNEGVTEDAGSVDPGEADRDADRTRQGHRQEKRGQAR